MTIFKRQNNLKHIKTTTPIKNKTNIITYNKWRITPIITKRISALVKKDLKTIGNTENKFKKIEKKIRRPRFSLNRIL